MKLLTVLTVLSAPMLSLTLVAQERDPISVPEAWEELLGQELSSQTALKAMLEEDQDTFFKEANVIRRLKAVEGSYDLYEQAIAAIASKSVDTPLPILEALSDSDFEDEHVQKIARTASESLVEQSEKALLDFLSDAPGSEGKDVKVHDLVLEEMLVAAFRLQPELALNWIKKTSGRVSLLEVEGYDVLRAVIDVSPESVIDLARTHEEIQLYGLNRACVALAKRDLDAASKAISQWKSRGEYPYREVIVAVASMLAKESGLDKSKAWSKSLGVDGQRAWYHVSAIEDSRATADALLAETKLSNEVRGQLSYEIVRHWAQEAPQDAAAFLKELAGNGVQSEHAYEAVAEHWLGKNLEEASTWVANLESEEMQNACTKTIVTLTLLSDPERAFQWALRLPDGQQYVEMAFRTWHRNDPEAATEGLGQADLPVKVKAPLLARP